MENMNTCGKNVEIKPLLAVGFLAFVFLLTPLLANAEWYWLTIPEDPTIGEFTELSAVEYAVTSIPKDQLHALPDNLMSAFGSTTDSAMCSGEYDEAVQELRDFDATHEFYTNACFDSEIKGHQDCGQVVNQETIDARTSLLSTLEKGAVSCLKTEQDELERQAQKEAEEERLAEIEEALKACDTDFFENEMTNEERMQTWDERQKCTNETEEVTSEPVEPIVEEVVTQPADTVTPVPVSMPDITSTPTVTTPPPTQKNDTVTNDTDEATSTINENVQEIAEDTTEEFVQLEPEQTAEVEKPSLFKKIASFFTKLFSW